MKRKQVKRTLKKTQGQMLDILAILEGVDIIGSEYPSNYLIATSIIKLKKVFDKIEYLRKTLNIKKKNKVELIDIK